MKKLKCFLILILVIAITAVGVVCYNNGNSNEKVVEATLV